MNFYLYGNQTFTKKMKKNLQKNLHNSKNCRIFALCLREKTQRVIQNIVKQKNLKILENRTIFIANIENKGIAVNCGANGEISKFTIVCFDSKLLSNVAKKTDGEYAVTFPKTEIKQTTIGTLCRWLDRSRWFENTTPDNALQRFATLDNERKIRIIERCYY